jgi:predicted nucleic acid-binding protein
VILLDTSVWIEHLRLGLPAVGDLLESDLVFTHPFVIGEIACGHLLNRARILSHLERLPTLTMARHDEVLRLIETHRLWGGGIGWIDAHLLTAVAIHRCQLWTRDRALQRAARAVAIEY